MSGGSMNYLYLKLKYDADFPEDTPERQAFAKHIQLVAKALHDIEWVDSGDYGPGDENEAIRACLRAAPQQRKPLTNEQVIELVAQVQGPPWLTVTRLIRAVENAHGIGEE